MVDDGSRRTQQSSRRWKDAQTSSESTTEPAAAAARSMKRVSVVYYLCRNGHLEHPHFMEVLLSSPDGLYLKDVMSRLNLLRGQGMASMYSWSSKRSYKDGFVWHDLTEDDYIHPVHGLEYVLKGSEIDGLANLIHNKSQEARRSEEDSDSSLIMSSRRNQCWSSDNLHECKVYRPEAASVAADASTQTDNRVTGNENQIVELEGSPPQVDSSPETLESLMKADKRLMMVTSGNPNEEVQSGRLKASSVLRQLITCGSLSFRDCGATAVKDHGLSLITQHKAPHAAGDEDNHVEKEVEALMEHHHHHHHHPSFENVKLEDKEYFSGSVIEKTQIDLLPSLKRSSSYK